MHEKLITTGVALLAFASFAISPGIASAVNKPAVTHPTGTVLNPGTNGVLIEGTNTGETMFVDGSGNTLTRCTGATVAGKLTKNSGGTIEGDIASAKFAGSGSLAAGEPANECTGSFGNVSVTPLSLPWCIRSTPNSGTEEFEIAGGNCGGPASSIKFILSSTTVGNCTYEGLSGVSGTIDTDAAESSAQDALLTIPGTTAKREFKRVAGGFLCPSVGYLDMDFTLETDTTNGIAEPIYISKIP
jgi:hypothetical protein